VNVGYINNIETNECIGIIGNTDTFISTYSKDTQLNMIFSCILKREQVKEDDKIISIYQPNYLHSFSYYLPYPYYLSKVVYNASEDENVLQELLEEVNTQ
jgi:hypothetical protein